MIKGRFSHLRVVLVNNALGNWCMHNYVRGRGGGSYIAGTFGEYTRQRYIKIDFWCIAGKLKHGAVQIITAITFNHIKTGRFLKDSNVLHIKREAK